jgi:hypothetical protein
VSIDRRESSAVPLARRLGFLFRWRARSGLLPGQVSAGALLRARRYRWTAWIGVPVLLLSVAVIATLSVGSSTSDAPAVVREASTVADAASSSGRFEVVLGDGSILFFDRDPNVSPGEPVLVRTTGNGAGVGLVVKGDFVPTSYTYESGWWPAVIGAIYIALALLFIAPFFVWGRQAHRQISADIDAPLASARGRYLGSWVWRGLSNRFARSVRRRGPWRISGFPVAIQERSDGVTWLVAPIDLLPDIRRFEEAIAEGTGDVVVAYHPNTNAIAKLEAADGTATVDVQQKLDRLSEVLTMRPRRRPRDLSDF